jgi:hypothetical protein
MEFGSYDEDSVTTGPGNDEHTPTAAGPLSPPSGAESLFLAGLATERLSALSLSEQIRINHKYNNSSSLGGGGGSSNSNRRTRATSAASLSSFMSARSAGTDDFASCVGSESDMLLMEQHEPSVGVVTRKNLNNMMIEIPFSSPRSMILQIPEEEAQLDSPTMSTTYTNAKYAAANGKKAPPTTAPSSSSSPDLSKVDAAEVVYAKAKDVWAWGKSIPVVGFFASTSEQVAGKALSIVGTDFGAVDTKVSTELAKLDTSVLNPAIQAIAKLVIEVAGKSEETLKPILDVLMAKLGMIKSEANEATPDAHKPPEVTPVKK